MGDFLRDITIEYLTLSEKELTDINDELGDILRRANKVSPPANEVVSLNYVLRYDGMGIVRTDFDEIKRCFNRAGKVERVVFQLTCQKNNVNKGKNIRINLDSTNPNNCILLVSDDDEAWVDSSFGRLEKLLRKYGNRNSLAHSKLIELLIQLVGVLFGLSLCLIGANLLAPGLSIRYSFFVLFVAFFLVFSNLWTYVVTLIGRARGELWPVISFKRKPLGLLGQTVIGFLITALLTGMLKISWTILKGIGPLATK